MRQKRWPKEAHVPLQTTPPQPLGTCYFARAAAAATAAAATAAAATVTAAAPVAAAEYLPLLLFGSAGKTNVWYHKIFDEI